MAAHSFAICLLVTNYIKHLFILMAYLPSIYLLQWNVLSRYFFLVFKLSILFSYCWVLRVFNIFWIQILHCIPKSVVCYFIHPNSIFHWMNYFNFEKFQFIKLSFCGLCYGMISYNIQKLITKYEVTDFLLCFRL